MNPSIIKNTKLLLGTLILIGPLIFSNIAYAESDSDSSVKDKPYHSAEKQEKRFMKMASKLKLSDEQEEKLKPLLKKHQDERKEAHSALRTKHKAELAEVLSTEQMAKLEKMHKGKKGKGEKNDDRKYSK